MRLSLCALRTERRSGVRRSARIVGFGSATAVTLGLLSVGVANADTFVPLPDGQRAAPGVVVTRTGESALISPSLAANGAGRVAWVSGAVTADVTGVSTDASSTTRSSRVSTGYIVGCQVDISGFGGSLGGGVDVSGATVSASVSVPVSAGQVEFVGLMSKDVTKNGRYVLEYQDTQIEVQNCGGYAQARAYTVVEIAGNHASKTVLYGQPFSIG